MKGDQITSVDIKRWKEDGRIPVACRLCGEVVLFPSKLYKEEDLVGYECANCKIILKLMGGGEIKVLAIEMEMPERCLDCQLNGDMKCYVNGNTTFDDIMRPRWCPLHEIDIERNGTVHISKD